MYSRSAVFGSGVVIAIPSASLTAQRMRTLAFFALGITLLFGAGIALALFVGGKISRSVQALKVDADAMGMQAMSPVPAMSFREADVLAQAMMRSADALAQRTEALQASLVALKTSEENYRLLVDGSPDAIVLHQDGKCLHVNPALFKFGDDQSAQA